MRRAAVFLMAAGLAAGAGIPPVIQAVRNGDTAALRTLVARKADVTAAEADGATALHWASYLDNVAAAELLLRAGAKVNAANDLGATPLWIASQNGSTRMVRRLLDAGADPNASLLAGETPVMVAARSGYPEIVEQLIAKGAKVNARGSRGQTALMWAVSQKHPEVVKVLLAHGADMQTRSDVWNDVEAVPPHGYLPYNRAIPHGGDTALLFAARAGDLASARMLVAAGANVNDADAWGVSATVLAAHSDFREIVDLLLDHGADANAAPAGFTALHEAILRRDEKMVSSLLAHGADPNAPLKTWTPMRRSSHDFHFDPQWVGASPFWLAARFTEPGVMRLLVAKGADPLFVLHAEYVTGGRFEHRIEETTALMAAMGMGGGAPWVQPPRSEREALSVEAAKLALDLGVNINAVDSHGSMALDGAKALGYEGLIRFLVEKGATSGKPVKKEVNPE